MNFAWIAFLVTIAFFVVLQQTSAVSAFTICAMIRNCSSRMTTETYQYVMV